MLQVPRYGLEGMLKFTDICHAGYFMWINVNHKYERFWRVQDEERDQRSSLLNNQTFTGYIINEMSRHGILYDMTFLLNSNVTENMI